jgi:hypothetical protein
MTKLPTFLSPRSLVILLVALLFSVLGVSASAARDRLNILVVYAADLGYGDVQCYNSERGKIPTPHIDKLAPQGLRFTDAHSSSGVCLPSRFTPSSPDVTTGGRNCRAGPLACGAAVDRAGQAVDREAARCWSVASAFLLRLLKSFFVPAAIGQSQPRCHLPPKKKPPTSSANTAARRVKN